MLNRISSLSVFKMQKIAFYNQLISNVKNIMLFNSSLFVYKKPHKRGFLIFTHKRLKIVPKMINYFFGHS